MSYQNSPIKTVVLLRKRNMNREAKLSAIVTVDQVQRRKR